VLAIGALEVQISEELKCKLALAGALSVARFCSPGGNRGTFNRRIPVRNYGYFGDNRHRCIAPVAITVMRNNNTKWGSVEKLSSRPARSSGSYSQISSINEIKSENRKYYCAPSTPVTRGASLISEVRMAEIFKLF
jgi:hypothetical protein